MFRAASSSCAWEKNSVLGLCRLHWNATWMYSSISCKPVTSGAPSHTTRSALPSIISTILRIISQISGNIYTQQMLQHEHFLCEAFAFTYMYLLAVASLVMSPCSCWTPGRGAMAYHQIVQHWHNSFQQENINTLGDYFYSGQYMVATASSFTSLLAPASQLQQSWQLPFPLQVFHSAISWTEPDFKAQLHGPGEISSGNLQTSYMSKYFNLAPTSRSSTEINNPLNPAEYVELIVDLQKFKSATCSPSLLLQDGQFDSSDYVHL